MMVWLFEIKKMSSDATVITAVSLVFQFAKIADGVPEIFQ